MNTPKPVIAKLQSHTDDALDYWGDVFVSRHIGDELDITFERFMQSPQSWVDALDRIAASDRCLHGSSDFEPLLPQQLRVQQAIDQANACSVSELDQLTDDLGRARSGVPASLRGDRLIEPCNPHTWRRGYTAERHNR